MSEFYGPIVYDQDPKSPLNQGNEFKPFVCGLNGSMATHGASAADYENAMKMDTSKPGKHMQDGFSMFLLETEMPLFLTDWAYESAVKNPTSRPKRAAKM
jgi:homogentisate 1,2-dioxygenase